MAPHRSGTRLFLKGARDDFRHTGAIAPSSRFLARAITSAIGPLAHDGRPLRVLEAGAGTGALTEAIVRRLPPGSRLDLYEMNARFAEHLQRRFAAGDGHGIEVAVHNRRVQEIRPDASYDAVISGLPLNNFEPAQVKEILETLMAALRPGGVLSWFEYLMIRGLKSMTTGPAERARLRRIGQVTGGFIGKYRFRRDAIFLNIPPAVVHHLRKPGAEAGY